MNNPTHLNHLKNLLAKERVLPVLGTGVSYWTSQGDSSSTWKGLLENGLDYCSTHISALPLNWEVTQRSLIDSGKANDFISVAEEISERLGAPDGPDFADWLKTSVGKLKVRQRDLLKVIGDFGTLIVTTNYDSLIEHVLGGPAITWLDYSLLQQVIIGDDYGVIHLHGYWECPKSIVLGSQSYERVSTDNFTQAIIQSLVVTKSLLFIGFGAGLSDPNFSRLRSWMSSWSRYSPYGHFRLVRDSEFEVARSIHQPDEKIIPISYGPEYSDLPAFLDELRKTAIQPKKRERRQIRWRTLEDLTIPITSVSEKSVGVLLGDLAFTLLRTFGTENRQQFTILYKAEVRYQNGMPFVVFQLHSHKADYLQAIRDYKNEVIGTLATMHANMASEEEITNYESKKVKERVLTLQGWKLEPDFGMSDSYGVLNVLLDPEARTIKLETEQVLSLNPDDYESRVKTTSELLRFLASCFNIEHAAINLDTVAEHPPLIPLLVDILDKTGIDLNGVRFNAANDEEWSYVNNRFGVEVGHYLGRSE